MDSWHIKSNDSFDRRYLNIAKKWWINIDKVNFLLLFAIIAFGFSMTVTSSTAIAHKIGASKFLFIKKQFIFAVIALILIVAISFLDKNKIKILALIGIAITVMLLIAVLIFGAEVKGAKRWISLAGFSIQPSELAKTFFVIFNAYILQRLNSKKWFVKYGASTSIFLIIVCLLLLQPDFGMTLTLSAIWAVQLFLYGLPMPLIIAIAFLAIFGGIGAYVSFPHVEDRINRFLDSGQKNYQVERSLDAFINGSFFGNGPGNGVVKKFIPDAHTDFIFAVVAEEYGIISCTIILVIFAYLISRIIRRALDEEDIFSYLALCGLVMQFSMQVVINVGVGLGLLPTKGMTLPFISYGGSSMISMSICFGIILALTKRKYHRNVDYGNFKIL